MNLLRYDDPVKNSQYECLISFTRGERLILDDHRWTPMPGGKVRYNYRERDQVTMDLYDAAISAGLVLGYRRMWV